MKYFILFVIVFFTFSASAQTWPNVAGRWNYQWLRGDSALFMPSGNGAPSGTASLRGAKYKGQASLYSDTTGKKLYMFNPKDSTWTDVTGTSGVIGPTMGGTGLITVTTGDILYGSATDTWAKLPGVATGDALISGGVTTAPGWGKIGLTTHVSGILPIANGGTGTSSPGIVAGTNITVSGLWPNQTINSTGGGGGGGTLAQNTTGDSIGTGSTMSVRVQDIANDNNSPCYWCDMTFSLPKSKLAHIRDTFAIVSDSSHFNIFIGPGTHSYGDDYSRYQMSMVDLLLAKYEFAGPGLFSGNMANYQFSPISGWTLRTLLTTPKGRGIAGQSLISTSTDITIASGTDKPQTSYNSYQDIIVISYDTSTGGKFSISVDGTIIDTINTAIGTGPTYHNYHLAQNVKHTILLHEVLAATTHCELLDLYLYTSNKRGIIVNKAACGSSAVTHWVAQNRSQAIDMLQHIPGGIDLIISDLGVNNQNQNVDTNTARILQDTLIKRWRVASPNVGIVLMKGTQYSFARYGTPLYSTTAYNRQLDQLARVDTVATFDNDRIVGPFPRSLDIGTVTLDSLHPTSQSFYTINADLLSNIGALNVDWGNHTFPNLFTGPDSSHIVNTASSQRYSIWDIHTWKNAGLNHFITVNSAGTQTLDQDITSVNQVNYTSLGGASTAYSWDGSGTFAQPVKSNNVTGSNQLKGRLYIGNANGAEDLDIKSSINGYTIASLNPTANSGFSLIRFKDGAGIEKDWLVSLGSSGGLSGAGTPYENNALALTALNGNLNIGSTASAGVFRIFTGGSTTGNNRLSITGTGGITFNNGSNSYTFPSGRASAGNVLADVSGTGALTWQPPSGIVNDQVHTSGTSVTISNGVTRLFVDPASALASLSITFPSAPYDGQVIKIFFGGTIQSSASDVVTGGITTWSITGTTVPALFVSPTPIKAGTVLMFEYRAGITTWYQTK